MRDHKVGNTCVGTKRLPLQLHVKITTNFALGRIPRGLQLDYLIKYLHQFQHYHIIGKKPGQFVRTLLVK